MRKHRTTMLLVTALGVLLTSWPDAAVGQDVALAGRRPRFLAALSSNVAPIEIDAGTNAVLRRLVSLDLPHPTVGGLFEEIERQTGLKFAFNVPRLRPDRPVELQAQKITVAAALTAILLDTGIDVLLRAGNHVVLVDRISEPQTQIGTIVGQVTDAKTGVGIVRVEIYLEGTKQHTATDTNGAYRLADVEVGRHRLAARRLGYVKQVVAVTVRDNATDTVNVALEPAATRLNEVVTTATGLQRRLELGNDITRINADSIVRGEPIASVTQLLEGRVPGLTVQHTSGAPGDPSRLRLRGTGSPRLSNDPIVIVDGMRVYAEQSSARSANLAGLGDTANTSPTAYATPSPLDQIDPNSIEKVEVLKGPSAATLYGQDAANGVIVITTKRGKAGPPRWSFLADHAQSRLAGGFPNLIARWGHDLVSNARVGFCPINNIASYDFAYSTLCTGDSVVAFQLLNDPATTVLDHGRRNAVTLGVSGGLTSLTYSVTGRYAEDAGLPKLPDYEVARYQSRLGTRPPDWMLRPQNLTQWGVTSGIRAQLGAKAEVTLTTSLDRTIQRRSSLEQQLGILMTTYLDKASGIYYTPGSYAYQGQNPETNDFLTGYFEQATSRGTTFRNGVNAAWRPSSVFTLTADAGLDVQQRNDQIFLPYGAATGMDSVGHMYTGQGTVVTTSLEFRGNTRDVRILSGAKFRFASGLGFTGISTRDQNFQTMGVAKGSNPSPGSSLRSLYYGVGDAGTFRLYAEPAVGFQDLWFTMGLQLHQQGTTDGPDTRSFWRNLKQQFRFPPTFHTSYLLSDKSFFPFKDVFQMFRVRTAFGRSGRQPGPMDRLRLYGNANAQWVAGNTAATEILSTLGNAELRPERATELEGGFDAELLHSGLTVTLSAYRKITDDMIVNVPLPPSVYGDNQSVQLNIGKLRNTGVEVQVTANLLRTGPVGLQAEVSLTQNHNVLLSLAPGVEPFYSGGNPRDGGIRVVPGYPLFGRWSLPIVGYADGNGNGVLESSEVINGDTAVYVGQTTPNYTANFRPTLSLFNRAISVSAGFNYDDGLSQQNDVAGRFAPFSAGQNVPGASIPEQLASQGKVYTSIQTVSTFRFNSLSINYSVPSILARRLGAQTLTVAVQGTNLGLWTNYRGLDPNVNAFSTGNDVIDTGVLPQPRSWQIRLNATY